MNLVANMSQVNLDIIPMHIQDQNTRRAWDALLDLFRRPWWTRCWILQKVAVITSDPFIRCGYIWLPWSKFKLARNLMGRSTSTRVLQTQSFIFTILNSVQIYKHLAIRIRMFLIITISFKATDPRDKVYTLLGLIHKDDRSAIKPDYDKSVEEIYTKLA